MKNKPHPVPTLRGPIKATDALRRIFFAVFAVLFTVTFVQVLFFNPHFSYNPLWVLLFFALWGALFYGLYRLCFRFGQLFAKKEKLCLALFFVLLVGTQVLFYWQTAAYPSRDFERVFYGAYNYTIVGYIEDPYLDYFYKYPNNMPLTILLQFYFRIFHRLGFNQFFLLGAVFNGGCIALTYFFVYLCCKRLFGTQWGFFSLGLLYLCLPLHCYISYFYTDTTTLLFAPFALYFYLRLRDAKTWKGRLVAAVILCAGLAFGTKLKYSVAIAFLALFIDMLLRLDWKNLLLTTGLYIALFAAVSALFNGYMYAHFLDESIAEDMATPFSAWVMMGLARDGTHIADDNYIIWNWPTKEEKQAQAMATMKQRLSSFTPITFLQFLNQKNLRSFGSGNLNYTQTVADNPVRDTFLTECIRPEGKYHKPFDTLNQGYYVALFAAIIAGAVFAFRRRNYTAFVPYLATFGLYLFLLLWESGERYLINFYGVFIIAAVFGMQQLFTWKKMQSQPPAHRQKKKRRFRAD